MPRDLQPTDYQHTRFLGFSVTRSFWDAFYAALPGVGLSQAAFELVWYSGGSIDVWADPNSHCWTSRDLGGAFLNPASSGGQGGLINGISDAQDPTVGVSAIDRVILNVSGLAAQGADPVLAGYNGGTRPDLGITGSTTGFPPAGYNSTVSVWLAYLQAAIANIRSKYTNVRMIILQPNVAGPSFATCPDTSNNNADSIAHGIRCTYTQPYVQSAIMAVTKANVRGGLLSTASACSDFADWAGHLTSTPQTTIGQAVAAYYAAHL